MGCAQTILQEGSQVSASTENSPEAKAGSLLMLGELQCEGTRGRGHLCLLNSSGTGAPPLPQGLGHWGPVLLDAYISKGSLLDP